MKASDRTKNQLLSELIALRRRIVELEKSETKRNKLERELKSGLKDQLTQLSNKNRYEAIISAVSRSVHQSINLQEVLENAVEAMNKNIDGVDNVGIYLVEGKDVVIKAYRGYHKKFIQKLGRIPYPKGFIWKTIIEGKPTYCGDVEHDKVIGPIGREAGTKSYVSMPICSEGKNVGAIGISSFLKKNAFSKEELRLLESVAQQIEMAINNARHADALRISEKELQRAKKELEHRVKERTAELLRSNELLKQEIKERKRVEKSRRNTQVALQESEAQFRTLFENAPEAISVLDLDSGYFIDVNEQTEKTLGYSREQLMNMSWIDITGPSSDIESGNKYLQEALAGGTPVFEWTCLQPTGKEVLCEVRLVRLPKHGRKLIRGSVIDITFRKQAEEQIKASLKEKEVLLMEIQHRVKNNLQVISSLIDLQATHIKNKQALRLFDETHNRIKSMALIQEQLYQTKNLAEIDFSEYLNTLCASLFQSFGVKAGSISLKINAGKVLLGVNTALTCGLIINEIVSNSLKHAFPDHREGEIRIDLNKNKNLYELIISDNGVGLPKDLDFRKINSLGLKLVNALTKQLDGTIGLSKRRGTKFRIRFSGID
ncbi:PAS domain S-box protein [Desulfobacterota bacterium AH_259_B03_O07]|nr:PAS domain S-box protein [Desulfobacterota bacterium AH_259_B03_O07]